MSKYANVLECKIMEIHNCILASQIERVLFEPSINSIYNIDQVSDDICPICLESLKYMNHESCCGGYSRKLRKCGHWVHVNCQINKNIENRHQCSLCRTKIINKNYLDKKILVATAINILPIHYQAKYLKEGSKIFDNEDNLKDLKLYKINVENVKKILENFDTELSLLKIE